MAMTACSTRIVLKVMWNDDTFRIPLKAPDLVLAEAEVARTLESCTHKPGSYKLYCGEPVAQRRRVTSESWKAALSEVQRNAQQVVKIYVEEDDMQAQAQTAVALIECHDQLLGSTSTSGANAQIGPSMNVIGITDARSNETHEFEQPPSAINTDGDEEVAMQLWYEDLAQIDTADDQAAADSTMSSAMSQEDERAQVARAPQAAHTGQLQAVQRERHNDWQLARMGSNHQAHDLQHQRQHQHLHLHQHQHWHHHQHNHHHRNHQQHQHDNHGQHGRQPAPVVTNMIHTGPFFVSNKIQRFIGCTITGPVEITASNLTFERCIVTGRINLSGGSILNFDRGILTGCVLRDRNSYFSHGNTCFVGHESVV